MTTGRNALDESTRSQPATGPNGSIQHVVKGEVTELFGSRRYAKCVTQRLIFG